MTQPGTELAPPDPIERPDDIPTTGVEELDQAVRILVDRFAQHLDGVADELYGALSYAYPGLYADPDAPTRTVQEYRVTETTGHVRHLQPAAAVAAHRLGLKVERRTVTTTEWETEPNPNTNTPRPIPDHPRMRDAAGLTPPGYPVGLAPTPAQKQPWSDSLVLVNPS